MVKGEYKEKGMSGRGARGLEVELVEEEEGKVSGGRRGPLYKAEGSASNRVPSD